jgi:hypothetical protein
MTDEFERIWKEVVMAQLRHYPSIHLEALEKSQETCQACQQRFKLSAS